MSEQRETEYVSGTVAALTQGVTSKGDPQWKVEVRVNPDDKYTRKLNTKSEDTAKAASALMGQHATFECGVSEWTNQEGKPVRSLWINAINPGTHPPNPGVPQTDSNAAGAVSAPQSSGSGVASASHSPSGMSRDEVTRASIEKQVALKCAVEFHADGGPDLDSSTVIETAGYFFAFLQGTASAVTTQKDAGSGSPAEGFDPFADDDSTIPF